MTEATSDSSRPSSRERFATRFRALRGEHGRAFARAIDESEPETGRLVCWGELARRFESAFTSDEQRIEALSVLVGERDLRALLLFANVARSRPAVLDVLLARAGELPITIQRALVTMVDPSVFTEDIRDSLATSAQQLLDDGDSAIAREREIVDSRIAELLSFGLIAPDSIDPREVDQESARPSDDAEGGVP